MRKFHVISTSVLAAASLASGALSGCGPGLRDEPEASRVADVATDAQSIGQFYLFYEDGNDVVRATCRTDTRIHDRSTCSTGLKRVGARDFWEAMRRRFGDELDRWDRDVREIYTLITRVDDRLVMLVNAAPDPGHTDLLPRIAAVEERLAKVEIKIAELNDQIARINQELALGDDPDLRAQLATCSEALAGEMEVRRVARDELAALRQEYVLGNASLLDQHEFEELQARRQTLVRDLDVAKTKVAREMDELVLLARAMKKTQDQLFVHDHPATGPDQPATQVVVREFPEVFAALELGGRTFRGELGDRAVAFRVPRQGKIERLSCVIRVEGQARCSQVEILGALQANPVQFVANLGTDSASEIRLNATPGTNSYSLPELKQLAGKDMRGTLGFRPVCAMIIIGGTPIKGADCTLVLE
jgi:uncharacterized coiled-coil protein SlyX